MGQTNLKSTLQRDLKAGGIFIRLSDDGDSVTGAFVGPPHPREVVWTGEKYESYDEKSSDHRDKRPSLRVAINVFVPDEGAMKVFEGSTQWFKELRKVRERHGLDKWLFSIERHGNAGDPRTFYSIAPAEKIDAEMRAQIEEAEPHNLAALVGGEGAACSGSSASSSTVSASAVNVSCYKIPSRTWSVVPLEPEAPASQLKKPHSFFLRTCVARSTICLH